MNIIDGKLISNQIREKLKEEIKSFPTKLKLVDIQIGNNEASNIYIKGKEKAASSIGIDFECIRFPENIEKAEVVNRIKELNQDTNTTGILLQLPIPNHLNTSELINYINPSKDVDGLTDLNQGKLVNGQDSLTSCTPSGVIKLLESYNIEINGKNIVIVGRSALVGKPLINLFLNKDATVTVCHSKTANLSSHTKQADILVVATGQKDLITSDMVKEESVIIDVGINRIDNKIYGDVDFENIKDKVSYITPVPGGVGPMTITMLLYNTVKAYKLQNK